jgi:hypothetical protein
VYHVKVLYVAVVYVTMHEGPIRSWHTKEAKCRERERDVFNHKNPTPNVTYLQKCESETLYPYNCVRNIYTYPKSKALGQALAHKPASFSTLSKLLPRLLRSPGT